MNNIILKLVFFLFECDAPKPGPCCAPSKDGDTRIPLVFTIIYDLGYSLYVIIGDFTLKDLCSTNENSKL